MGPPPRRRRAHAPLRTAVLSAGVGALALAAAAAAFAQPAGQASEAGRRRALLSAVVGVPAALAGASVAGADLADGLVVSDRKGPRAEADLSDVIAPMSPKSKTGVPMSRPSLGRLAKGAASRSSDVSPDGVPWGGYYDDPEHPGCKRYVGVGSEQGSWRVSGRDAERGSRCKYGVKDVTWAVQATVAGESIVIDFSPKGGPKNLEGKWVGDGIQFPDGNKWTKKVTKPGAD